MISREYSAAELLEFGKTFKQTMKEPLIAWLVRLWDMGAYGISLTAVEAEKLSHVTNFPSTFKAKAS